MSAEAPAATAGSSLLGIPTLPEGQRRTPEEVEEMALRAASQASHFRKHLATAQGLVDTSAATLARLKGRATRGLAHYRSFLRRSSSSYSRDAGRDHPWSAYTSLGQADLDEISAEILLYI